MSLNNSKHIKSNAVSAKRTATSINSIVEYVQHQLKYESSKALLSLKDLEELKNSAHILRKFGDRASVAANIASKEEAAVAMAIEKNRKEAEQLIAKWSTDSMIEKVSIVLADNSYYANYIGQVLEKDCSRIDYFLNEALLSISCAVASDAHRKGKKVEEIMVEVVAKISEVKSSSIVNAMIARWEVKSFEVDQKPSSHATQSYGW